VSGGTTTSTAAFFAQFEIEINSFSDLCTALLQVPAIPADQSPRFLWRGVSDASWGLHSSLYRYATRRPAARLPIEEKIQELVEELISKKARWWGLQGTGHHRLSGLELLATLQHFGSPTRLLDGSMNAHTALWFAVEKADHVDGRLFLFDVSGRNLELNARSEDWELRDGFPWQHLPATKWMNSIWVWTPRPFEPRIAAQQAAFIIGPAPSECAVGMPGMGWRGEKALIDKVTGHMSILLNFRNWDELPSAVDPVPQTAYTLRISAGAKDEIRRSLESLHGVHAKTLFPDFSGFTTYARWEP
jgi:hypothetical protein